MAGGFSRPRKDKQLKVTGGQLVRTGQILIRGLPTYKSGKNVKGLDTLFALCDGKVSFIRRKTPHGRFRTVINVIPVAKE